MAETYKYSDKVLEFATKAHEGQVRKYTGDPYIIHPIAVAKRAVELANEYRVWNAANEEIIRSISYLHDVLEDTSVTARELREFLLTIAPLEDVNRIMYSVQLLTKIGQPLIVYLEEIKRDLFAKIVKRSDVWHNSSDLKDQKKLDVYTLVEYFLTH